MSNGSYKISGSVTTGTPYLLYVTFNFNGKPVGYYNLTVTTAWGRSSTKVNGFRIIAPGAAPVVTGIDPGSGLNNASLPVTISGSDFRTPNVFISQGSILKLAPATAGKTSTTAKLYVTLPLTGLSGGLYNITVANNDGVNGTAPNIFYLTDLSRMSPVRTTNRAIVQNPGVPDTGSIPSGAVNPLNRGIPGQGSVARLEELYKFSGRFRQIPFPSFH